MLSTQKVTAFIPTTHPARSKAFYRDILGLKLVSEDKFALVFAANGTPLRITTVPKLEPHPFTVLGWNVKDISAEIKELTHRGVQFERFGFLEQDPLGIWAAPGGTKVAWFKDPDGNLLSLSELN